MSGNPVQPKPWIGQAKWKAQAKLAWEGSSGFLDSLPNEVGRKLPAKYGNVQWVGHPLQGNSKAMSLGQLVRQVAWESGAELVACPLTGLLGGTSPRARRRE